VSLHHVRPLDNSSLCVFDRQYRKDTARSGHFCARCTAGAERPYVNGVRCELAPLATLLQLISEDAKYIDSFPKPLRKHISGIITDCELVLLEVQRLIEKYGQPGFIKSSK
jgi:hypothetical protein